ncbi:rRNA maturation RNase YbeY [Mycoplasma marinum]|uniref:Endoribonuclease YbeY n=1 Tax=Mycoplasma marinum TaxID=1937190 RepID=A0A4V2NI57_9MOLU|nr:rRNA maturation RNase YbeY [Mycoplasma marinum]TCG11118.1 rRNA maturation RNase YbeY [Mycoplasma marinum]
MNKILITNKTKYKFKHKKLFKKIVKYVGEEFQTDSTIEVSLIIVDNLMIKELNKKYREKDYATDVLSFPQGAIELRKQIGYYLMGDIYISWEKIIEQTKMFGHSEKREWSYIFTHGMLHLFGLDHIIKEEEDYMNSIAYKIMEKIKVGRQ